MGAGRRRAKALQCQIPVRVRRQALTKVLPWNADEVPVGRSQSVRAELARAVLNGKGIDAMVKLRVSSSGMLLVLAVLAVGGIYLLDSEFFSPRAAGRQTAVLRERAAKVEHTVWWALRAEEKRLAGLSVWLSRDAGLVAGVRAGRPTEALTRLCRQLSDVDVVWVSDASGREIHAWGASGTAVAGAIRRKATAGPMAGPIAVGPVVLILGVSDVAAEQEASAPVGRVYVARRVGRGLLAELGAAASAEVGFVRADRLPENVLGEASGLRSVWLKAEDRLAAAWPVEDGAGKRLGYFRAELSVAESRAHALTARKNMVVLMLLCAGAIVLVILASAVLLANPMIRLVGRLHRLAAGEGDPEHLDRRLHAETRTLARTLKRAFRTFTQLSSTDDLTGLANRREFDRALSQALLEARRYHRSLSVMVIDIDLFKAVNDTSGHEAGDAVLKAVAETMIRCCRRSDLPARRGGDEFAILLPGTSAAGATVVADRLRRATAERGVQAGGSKVHTTLSIGIADLNAGKVGHGGDLVALADRAVYAAKRRGRNRVVQAHELLEAAWTAGDRETDRVANLRGRLSGLDIQFNALFVRALQEIVQVQESRDPHMAHHARKVQHYAGLIARGMGLPEAMIRRIEVASLVHDIGMLALPDEIAACTGPLDSPQLEAMRRHPLIGARILDGMEFLEPVMSSVRSHHERWDGSGYPDGLSQGSVGLIARIVAVADAFDAMTSPRSFRGAKGVSESLAELESEAGSQFDPGIVNVFLAEARRLGKGLTDVPLARTSAGEPVPAGAGG